MLQRTSILVYSRQVWTLVKHQRVVVLQWGIEIRGTARFDISEIEVSFGEH
jgi:hypothetical protein